MLWTLRALLHLYNFGQAILIAKPSSFFLYLRRQSSWQQLIYSYSFLKEDTCGHSIKCPLGLRQHMTSPHLPINKANILQRTAKRLPQCFYGQAKSFSFQASSLSTFQANFPHPAPAKNTFLSRQQAFFKLWREYTTPPNAF